MFKATFQRSASRFEWEYYEYGVFLQATDRKLNARYMYCESKGIGYEVKHVKLYTYQCVYYKIALKMAIQLCFLYPDVFRVTPAQTFR